MSSFWPFVCMCRMSMLLSMFLYVWFASMSWFAKVDSVVAVSYTHLTCRMPMLLSMFLYVWFASMRWFAKVDSVVAVSYTHLDVYKRQHIHLHAHTEEDNPCE